MYELRRQARKAPLPVARMTILIDADKHSSYLQDLEQQPCMSGAKGATAETHQKHILRIISKKSRSFLGYRYWLYAYTTVILEKQNKTLTVVEKGRRSAVKSQKSTGTSPLALLHEEKARNYLELPRRTSRAKRQRIVSSILYRERTIPSVRFVRGVQ